MFSSSSQPHFHGNICLAVTAGNDTVVGTQSKVVEHSWKTQEFRIGIKHHIEFESHTILTVLRH